MSNNKIRQYFAGGGLIRLLARASRSRAHTATWLGMDHTKHRRNQCVLRIDPVFSDFYTLYVFLGGFFWYSNPID